jgi:hypothetical protein
MSLTTEPMKDFQVFYSYAHEDERWRKKLETHLSSLKRKGLISGWYDRNIKAGQEWEQEIDTHLNTADIILLLISPDFLASDYCYCTEMKRAMERHEAGVARVIPIILRPVDWQGTPFDKLQVLPTDAKAVTEWSNSDRAFMDIVKGIRNAVEDLSKNIGEVAHIKGTRVASPPTNDSGMIGPLGTQQFNDEIIDRVKEALDKLHRTYKSQVLPINGMHEFFLTLSMLFVRKTFQEKIRDCEDHNWRGRLRAACLTKKVLWAYMTNVLQFGPPVYRLYQQLLREVDGYTMGLMGLFKLSESHHKLDDIERYIFDAEEFNNYLPDQFLRTKIPQKSMIRCDNHLERIEALVKQLTASDASP